MSQSTAAGMTMMVSVIGMFTLGIGYFLMPNDQKKIEKMKKRLEKKGIVEQEIFANKQRQSDLKQNSLGDKHTDTRSVMDQLFK
ncbi:hypothetical protein QR98_0035790 [Sarcoptes scabiei]|uniref:Uncharacterized protein n=1 Tax=Sarcoptes scabiei TaxID=52283 RepID=A0A132A409_SARSC|nr:hypothetical protein QR98_0035790 [Sarcoptes scabiei]